MDYGSDTQEQLGPVTFYQKFQICTQTVRNGEMATKRQKALTFNGADLSLFNDLLHHI